MMKVLITRPELFNKQLKQMFKSFDTHILPIIQLKAKHRPQIKLDSDKSYLCLFVSRAAALYGYPLLGNSDNFQLIAQGPGTSGELQNLGAENIICGQVPPFDSAALKKLSIFDNVKNKECLLFSGNEYSCEFESWLIEQEAHVKRYIVYERSYISDIPHDTLDWLGKEDFVVILTSRKIAKQFFILFGELSDILQRCWFLVGHPKVAEICYQRDTQRVILASSVCHQDLLDSLLKKFPMRENSD